MQVDGERYPSTPYDLGNAEWLAIWGNFMGGSVGRIATLIAISITLNQNDRKRVDVMPYLNFRVTEDNFYNLKIYDYS